MFSEGVVEDGSRDKLVGLEEEMEWKRDLGRVRDTERALQGDWGSGGEKIKFLKDKSKWDNSEISS